MDEKEKITDNQIFMMVKSFIQNGGEATAILEGITSGYRDREKRIREQYSWAQMSLSAALMLINSKTQTPALKRHLEFSIKRHLETSGPCLNQAEKDFIGSVSLTGEAK